MDNNEKITSVEGISDYQRYLLLDFSKQYDFEGKSVLEIGSDYNMCNARAMLNIGAKEVYCANPALNDNLNIPNNIHKIKKYGEEIDITDKKFDIIYGVAVIEHINNLKELFTKLKTLIKQDGIIYIQGRPLWTAPEGHHTWVDLNNGESIRFNNENNPFEPWEHLQFDSECELKKYLKETKNFNEEKSEKISTFIFNDCFLTRKTPSEIIKKLYEVAGLDIKIHRYLTKTPRNKFFDIAMKKYDPEDLTTSGLSVYATLYNK